MMIGSGFLFNLETAVRDGKVMQGFDSESLERGDSHSRLVKGSPRLNDSGSKDCVNLPSPTAVSRFNWQPMLLGYRFLQKETSGDSCALEFFEYVDNDWGSFFVSVFYKFLEANFVIKFTKIFIFCFCQVIKHI